MNDSIRIHTKNGYEECKISPLFMTGNDGFYCTCATICEWIWENYLYTVNVLKNTNLKHSCSYNSAACL